VRRFDPRGGPHEKFLEIVLDDGRDDSGISHCERASVGPWWCSKHHELARLSAAAKWYSGDHSPGRRAGFFLLAYFESARLNYEVVLWIMGIRPVLELKRLRRGGKIIVWEVLPEAGLA
jgi:hypothetical protein